MTIAISSPAIEGPYEAAKWLKICVLADVKEFQALFDALGPFQLCPLGGLRTREEIAMPKEAFLELIQTWTDQLRQGTAPTQRCAFALTLDPSCLWLQEAGDRFLTKIRWPVIQIQTHYFTFAQEEKTFHSMVSGKDSVFWGVQFSWPQIFMDPLKQDLVKVDESFTHHEQFVLIRQLLRDLSRPTPFLVQGQKMNATFRLGKSCFPWIANHPQLKLHGLEVEYAR